MVRIIHGDKYTTFIHNSYIYKEKNLFLREMRHKRTVAHSLITFKHMNVDYLNITFFPLTMYIPLPGFDTCCPLRL